MLPNHFSKLNDYFDSIYVLSVNEFRSRQETVSARLKGLDFDFFFGTNKLNIEKEDLIKRGVYDEKLAVHFQRRGMVLSIGEIACSLSHRDLYSKIVEEGVSRSLILEDDVFPIEEALPFIDDILQELPASWELVYFGYLKHEKVSFKVKLKQAIYKFLSRLDCIKWDYEMVKRLLPLPYTAHLNRAGLHDCTHAYAISLNAARKLIDAQTPIVHRADDLLSYMVMKGQLEAFITLPKIFDQEGFCIKNSLSMKSDTV